MNALDRLLRIIGDLPAARRGTSAVGRPALVRRRAHRSLSLAMRRRGF